MSSLGPLTFGKKEEQIFLGREIAQHQDYSEDTAIKIDQEVKRIVMEQYERARQIIMENSDALIVWLRRCSSANRSIRFRFAASSPACRLTRTAPRREPNPRPANPRTRNRF